MKQLTTTILLSFSISLFSQFYHPDPYKYSAFWAYSMEFEKEDILNNGIRQIERWSYEFEEDSVTIKDSTLDYSIWFNDFGLPIKYKEEDIWPVNKPWYKRKFKWVNTRIDMYDYLFEYDSLQRLVHILELYSPAFGEGNYYQNDIYNTYDAGNHLTYQFIEEKDIYLPKQKGEDKNYPNDTNRIKIYINYQGDNVETVYRTSDDYNHFTYNERWDTLSFNCSLDSVFLSQPLAKGVVLDSLNRVWKTTLFTTHARGLTGCYSPESENDIVYTHFYDLYGRCIRIEANKRVGEYVWTTYYEYENNLLHRIWNDRTLSYSRYKYTRIH